MVGMKNGRGLGREVFVFVVGMIDGEKEDGLWGLLLVVGWDESFEGQFDGMFVLVEERREGFGVGRMDGRMDSVGRMDDTPVG